VAWSKFCSHTKGIVLVYSEYYNKISWTGEVIIKRNLFLTVLEAGKSKVSFGVI
jgi:hypothetical protein